MALRWMVFIVGSVANVIFSWRALRRPRCHGFYRFFVFQSIVILVALNISHWFQNPFCSRQIASWVMLTASLIYAAAGAYYLIKLGKPNASARADGNYTFESTIQLVESGWYRFIRHPMYGSLLLLAWGAFLKHIDLYTSACILVATIFVLWTAKTEERENVSRFGAAYADYMVRTRRFFPLLF